MRQVATQHDVYYKYPLTGPLYRLRGTSERTPTAQSLFWVGLFGVNEDDHLQQRKLMIASVPSPAVGHLRRRYGGHRRRRAGELTARASSRNGGLVAATHPSVLPPGRYLAKTLALKGAALAKLFRKRPAVAEQFCLLKLWPSGFTRIPLAPVF